MYEGILLPDSTKAAKLKTEYLTTLSAPLDAYWEQALIGFSGHYEIEIDGKRSGFYCLNGENQLVAFYLTGKYVKFADEVFSFAVDQHKVGTALAGTNDPFFLSLCLDNQKSVSVHTLLFEDIPENPDTIEENKSYSFDLAGPDNFEEIFEHYCATSGAFDTESVESGFENITGYVRSLMDDHRIFILRENGVLIATSECRVSKTQVPYADVGMIVAAEHRRKGVGSYILARTKEFCHGQNAKPICSCEAGNIGSKKAIEKAGFVSKHRIVEVDLRLESATK